MPRNFLSPWGLHLHPLHPLVTPMPCIDSLTYITDVLAGSPFTMPVIDGRKATASGECLCGVVVANKPCSFDINTRMVNGDGPLYVAIMCKIHTCIPGVELEYRKGWEWG